MSTAAAAGRATPALHWPAGAWLADRSIAGLVFLSGFVIVEPAPYDLLLGVATLCWAFFGMRLNRYTMPMTALLLLYLAGGFLSFTQIGEFGKPFVYMLTTGLLIASSIFFAVVIVEDPAKRMAIIRHAYVASAMVVAAIGILAYFNLIPNADFFKLYDRAKGTFQDPNVFGPFLALPAAFLSRDVLTRRFRDSLPQVAALFVILFAIFLSFSRAAWGLVLFAILATAFLAYVGEQRSLGRVRIVGYLMGGGAALAMLLAVAISIPSVANLYQQRAQVVQSYDESPEGRFENQKLGFFLVQEKPFGLGPYVFSAEFGADEHNMWLKGFTTYGWLGGFAYIALVLWTLAAAFPLLFKPRPWQGVVQCTYTVFLGHVVIHNVIDNDHWRHLFLIYGILWGAIAAEKMLKRRRSGGINTIAPSPVSA